jgi:hypothetical protein
MTLDQATNVLLPAAALVLVVYSAGQLFLRRDRFWPFRLGQVLVVFGLFALSANLLFGRSYGFVMVSTRATEVCCLAGGIFIVVAMLTGRDPTRDGPA